MKILVVCTGNICRSPLAACALARSCASMGLDVDVDSAGTHGLTGHGAADLTLETARECGLDLTPHRAKRISLDLLDAQDLVVVMERHHHAAVLDLVGTDGPDVRLLGEFRPGARRGSEIPDPYGGSRREYERARDLILQAVEGLANHLLSWPRS